MIFANRELAQRLERAEGFACTQFAAARKKIFPGCDVGMDALRRRGRGF